MPDEFYKKVHDLLEVALEALGGCNKSQEGVFNEAASLIMDAQDVTGIALGDK